MQPLLLLFSIFTFKEWLFGRRDAGACSGVGDLKKSNPDREVEVWFNIERYEWVLDLPIPQYDEKGGALVPLPDADKCRCPFFSLGACWVRERGRRGWNLLLWSVICFEVSVIGLAVVSWGMRGEEGGSWRGRGVHRARSREALVQKYIVTKVRMLYKFLAPDAVDAVEDLVEIFARLVGLDRRRAFSYLKVVVEDVIQCGSCGCERDGEFGILHLGRQVSDEAGSAVARLLRLATLFPYRERSGLSLCGVVGPRQVSRPGAHEGDSHHMPTTQ